jgi:hypothetical protein
MSPEVPDGLQDLLLGRVLDLVDPVLGQPGEGVDDQGLVWQTSTRAA